MIIRTTTISTTVNPRSSLAAPEPPILWISTGFRAIWIPVGAPRGIPGTNAEMTPWGLRTEGNTPDRQPLPSLQPAV